MTVRGVVVTTKNGKRDEFSKIKSWLLNEDRCLNLYDENGNIVVMYNTDSWASVGYLDVKPYNS